MTTDHPDPGSAASQDGECWERRRIATPMRGMELLEACRAVFIGMYKKDGPTPDVSRPRNAAGGGRELAAA